MRRIPWLVEQLSAFQELRSSTEFVYLVLELHVHWGSTVCLSKYFVLQTILRMWMKSVKLHPYLLLYAFLFYQKTHVNFS
jgi:hypothetical protein